MYLPVHSEVDFQCGWLVFSIKEILRLAVTPCSCAALLQTAICYRGLCLKFGNAIGELNTKKVRAIGKLKNLTMIYKWRNIKGQVAHRSRGTWGVGRRSRPWCNHSSHVKIRVPYHDGRQLRLRPSFDGNKRPFPVRLPYVRRVVTGPNGTGTVPVWRTRLSV